MDGYVAEAGNTLLHLLDKVLDAKSAWKHPGIKLAEEIIKQQYGTGEQGIDRAKYELTDNPNQHGDREYHYNVDFTKNNIIISVYKWGYNMPFMGKQIFEGNLEQYKKYVAQEVAEQDKRIKAYEEKIKQEKQQAINALKINKDKPIIIERVK
tara:strand:+ start:30 stop:488 length:459 start_codon:yes stop_codon:yes gene_type:complete